MKENEPWKLSALCRGLPTDIWFSKETEETAIELCNECPVIAECAEYAKRNEGVTGYVYGVYGGRTAAERRDSRGA